MTDRQQMEELARIDFLEEGAYDGIIYDHTEDEWLAAYLTNEGSIDGVPCILPNYLNSDDAMKPLIDGLTHTEFVAYCGRLAIICGGWERAMKATPRQKAEALLDAKGLYEND